jgi:hypothetical protein
MAASDKQALRDKAMEEIRRVEGILRQWDPINVQPGVLAPSDEYDSYAPHIVSMVAAGCSVDELANHLESLAVETMGIGPSSSRSRAHSSEFASQIMGSLRAHGPNRTAR